MNGFKKLKGDRKCKACHGLCSSGSYRTNYKKRQIYYCCFNCLGEGGEFYLGFGWIERVEVIQVGASNG